MKRVSKIISALAFATVVSFASCNGGFKKTDSGLEFKIHNTSEGPKAKEKDILTYHIKMTGVKTDGVSDTVLYTSWGSDPIEYPLVKSQFKGSLEEGFSMMAAGDSATFLISADSLFDGKRGQKLPEFLKKGSKVTFIVKMLKIQSEEQYMKDLAKKTEKMKGNEAKEIAAYVQRNTITAKPLENGIYFISTLEGTGIQADSGKAVTVDYTGKLLNGEVFDSSTGKERPFSFVLGTGQVIQGWDICIRMMRVGGKATLIIPSEYAYGARGAGGVIDPYTPLVFDVELKSVSDSLNQ